LDSFTALFGVDRRELQLKVPRKQPPGVDNFVDELELLFGLTDDRFARLHVAVLGQRFTFDQLSPSNDAIERAAQIVRDDAEVIIGEPVDVRRVTRHGIGRAIGFVLQRGFC
jgi:hypothetical protein